MDIPMEWIDKLFGCMEEFYGHRWERNFKTAREKDFYKTIWQHGLVGLSYEQIKSALLWCKRASVNPQAIPPHVMEFFRCALGKSAVNIDYQATKENERGDPVIARKAINEIRSALKQTI